MRLTYYGDDFTGSTDVLECLVRAGVPTVLFTEPPTQQQLSDFPDVQAVGVAGLSRSLAPDEMLRELVPRFEQLRQLGAPLCHYKVCSTFDSSPQTGNIGTAIEAGFSVFDSRFVPIVVGFPALGRYVTFGNLFARAGGESEPFRLDRHPSMRHHPTTPMDEADLRLHLRRQTQKHIALFDVLQLNLPTEVAEHRFDELLDTRPDVVLFDTLYPSHLPLIGNLISQHATPKKPLFCVGSSGLEYALTAHWQAVGEITAPPKFSALAVKQIVVVSGSCSPITARQIEWADENGFETIALDCVRLLNTNTQNAEIERAVEASRRVLSWGKSPLLHTCRGPQDPRLNATRKRLKAIGGSSSQWLGTALGQVLDAVWSATDLKRAIVTGGDTSSYVARALGIEALEFAAPLVTGSPLCRIHAPKRVINGREIAFKGGQVGKIDFFGTCLSPHLN